MDIKERNIAKSLIKKFKPYYDSETGISKDAPDDVKEAYERFTIILEHMYDNRDWAKNPPYFENEEQAKEWTKKNKSKTSAQR